MSSAESQQFEAKLEHHRQESEAKLEQQRQAMEQQRHKFEAKLEQQRKDSEVKVEHLTRLLQSDRHLPTLQARIESLHAAKLLSDEELYAIWDVIADSVDPMSDDTRVLQLVELSARMLSDTAFSRQLRRKML